MKHELKRIPVTDTKLALCNWMQACAGVTNRVRALYELAQTRVLEPSAFLAIIGQHPDTLQRDLEYAESEFQNAKKDYEGHCEKIGVAAYAVYIED